VHWLICIAVLLKLDLLLDIWFAVFTISLPTECFLLLYTMNDGHERMCAITKHTRKGTDVGNSP